MKKNIFATVLCMAVIFSAFSFSCVSADSDKTVYLSKNGSDAGSGTEKEPFATVEKAFSALPTGGEVFVSDEIPGVWFESSMKDTPHTGTVFVKGTDGTAKLRYKSPVFYGNVSFDNMILESTENFSFFNTAGHDLYIGENVRTQGSAYIHVGSNGDEGIYKTGSTRTEIKNGSYTNVYIGGCYNKTEADGIYGDTDFIMSGGRIDSLTIGFDSYRADQTDGTVNGDITILLSGSADIGNIKTKKIKGGRVEGSVILINKGATVGSVSMPEASGGVYLFNVSGNGSVEKTAKNGTFLFTPDEQDHHILLDGNEISKGENIIKAGSHTVRFVKSIDSGDIPTGEIKITGGKYNELVTDRAYSEEGINGIYGDLYMTLDGTAVEWLNIGFSGSVGTINGNVTVELDNGADAERISHKNLSDNTVNGAVNIIFNNSRMNFTPYIPTAEKGLFMITSIGSGKVTAEEEIGVFRIKPDKGYTALVDGKFCEDECVTLSPGAHRVTYVRKGKKLACQGSYIKGYPDGTFLPDGTLKRSEAATLLSNLIFGGSTEEISENYSDVAPDDWFYQSVAALCAADAMPKKLKNSEIFDPEKNITRGEFCEMICALCGSEISVYKLTTFPDVNAGDDCYEAVTKLAGSGYIMGYPDGTFGAEKTLTRAEAVTVINRVIGRKKSTDGASLFSDVKDHWAKDEIGAALSSDSSSRDGEKYVIPDGGTEEYIKTLYEMADTLSGKEIENASFVIADKLREDIVNTKDETDVKGTKYYVAENGNDSNDGKSPDTAWKTLAKVSSASLSYGDAVLFRRGDIFRGTVNVKYGVTYSAYGQGDKPVIMQSARNYADASLWEKTAYENVWMLKQNIDNVGIIGFDQDVHDHSEKTYTELCGIMLNKRVMGFRGIGDMKNDLEFYSDLDSQKLYVYSTGGNPGERFRSIEIGTRQDIFSGSAADVTIDNLSVKFTGAHGMGGAGGTRNRVVKNCIFSWLGGSILSQDYMSLGPVNYGNAVEIYGGCNGFCVENCWIYQIYDTAVTHQYSSGGDCTQENVRYIGNLMEYVHWGIEFYNQGTSPIDSVTKYTRNVRSEYNVLRYGGYGWGSPQRYRECAARPYCGWLGEAANYDWETNYNLFYKSTGFLYHTVESENEVQHNNIYIQNENAMLGIYKSNLINADIYAAKALKEKAGDPSSLIVLTSRDVENERELSGTLMLDTSHIDNENGSYNTFSVVKTELRSDGEKPEGLRFVCRLGKNVLAGFYNTSEENTSPASAEDNAVGYGFAVIPENLLSGELTKETKGAKTVPAAKVFSDNENYIEYTVCITGIPEKRSQNVILARPYITYVDTDGRICTSYGSVSRSSLDGVLL